MREKGQTDQKNATKGLAGSSAHRCSMSKARSRVVLVLVLGLAAFTAATTTSGFSGELGYRGGERGEYERVYRYQGTLSPREERVKRALMESLGVPYLGIPYDKPPQANIPRLISPEKPPEGFRVLKGRSPLNPGAALRRSPSVEHETNTPPE
jgi:hypothetical protein